MFHISVSGPASVVDDATETAITEAARLKSFDGLGSGRETCSKYHAGTLADIGVKGGAVVLKFDAAKKKLLVVSEFTSPRKLTAAELRELVEDTEGQWSDGIGEGCFDSAMEKRKVFIDLMPDGAKSTVKQVDDGVAVAKPSASKELATRLAKAAETGDLAELETVLALKPKLDTRGKYGWTPLVFAIANDKLDAALRLIQAGASPTVADKEGSDPLKWAAIRSGWVTSHQNVKLAEALLAAGAPVDAPDREGYTPLLWAANRGMLKLMKLLIDRGANVNSRTTEKWNEGHTALRLARDIAAVRVLLAAGADPAAVDDNGEPTWEGHAPAVAKLLQDAAKKKKKK